MLFFSVTLKVSDSRIPSEIVAKLDPLGSPNPYCFDTSIRFGPADSSLIDAVKHRQKSPWGGTPQQSLGSLLMLEI